MSLYLMELFIFHFTNAGTELQDNESHLFANMAKVLKQNKCHVDGLRQRSKDRVSYKMSITFICG